MDKKEIALEIVIAMIERGSYMTGMCKDNESYGAEIAKLYNSILNTIQIEE